MKESEKNLELVTHYDRFVPNEVNNHQKRSYLETNILPLLSFVKDHDRILEVGPGKGELLCLLRDKGYTNIHAHECCTAFANDLRAMGFSVDSRPNAGNYLRELGNNHFQAVLLIDVLEHMNIHEGLDFLEACFQSLKEGGRLILQVPNASGLFGLTTFTADPTHMTLWNELRLKTVLEARGYTNVKILPMDLPPSLPNRVRKICRSMIFSLIRLTTRICGATPVSVLTHNVIGVAEKPTR